MKIAILGTGNVGRALGVRAAEAGHEVTFGSRDPRSEKCRQLAEQAPGRVAFRSWKDAAADAELLVLAVPWSAAREALEACGDLSHCVLVDCINPLKPDLSGLDLDDVRSASEQLARWSPAARIVKAFNTLSAASMSDPQYGKHRASMFYCGDDLQGKQLVAQLADDLQLEGVDAGPLANAEHLESVAMLYIHLAVNGWGSNCALKMLTREKPPSQ